MRQMILRSFTFCLSVYLAGINMAYATHQPPLQAKAALPATSSAYCPASNQPLTAASVTLDLATFSGIRATGPVKLMLLGEQKKQRVTLESPAELVQFVNVSVKNNTLLIDARPPVGQIKPVFIRISLIQPLAILSLRGSASAVGQQLANPNLIIVVNDSASVMLRGDTPALGSIQNDSIGYVAVSGLNSQRLLIGGNGAGKIVLSGKTNDLDAKTGGNLVLDARQLQTKQAHILTAQNANSYVSALNTLYAFADNNSHIYYYQQPKEIAISTHASGNVLKIAD